RDAGRELGASLAVEVHVDRDPRFLRVALDSGAAWFRHLERDYRFVSSAASTASFSSGVPTVRRRQCASDGCHPCRFFTSMPERRSNSNQAGASGTRASTKLVWVV